MDLLFLPRQHAPPVSAALPRHLLFYRHHPDIHAPGIELGTVVKQSKSILPVSKQFTQS
jgi:hypothetical protein